jgi:isopentenyl diphosphate isomerase/L-lactate dehydrogenase-like FMN-dependent dehydrogenase
LKAPNLAEPGQPAPAFADAYARTVATPPPTWEDVRWLADQWEGPFMVKGVMRLDDAKRAIDAGATAISVSNHGGNNLDGTPAPIRVLPAIAEEVGDQIEVVMDGGIRRGGDVAKALALGAKAVMIGRPYLWALAAGGQAGVENLIDVLRVGLDTAVFALGHSSVRDLRADDLDIPNGFSRRLGIGDVSAATAS